MSYKYFIKLILPFFGIILFIFGFIQFSTSQTFKNTSQNFQKSSVDKVILIVIDALRFDMTEKYSSFNDLNTGVYSNISLRYKVKLQTPSVTMPRIKTITTGDISNFFDLILNLKSTEITNDNIIDILIEHRKFRLNFFGDDTWNKLFPNRFQKVDLTNSFFVKDYYEVDNNVTRNIAYMMNNLSEWDMTIMHYLGLDHIGHVEGPFSELIPPKLTELSQAINRILKEILHSSFSNSSLIIVTGDHGMSDLGGHGGATVNELTTSAFFISNKLNLKKFDYRSPPTIDQSDLSTIIAILTGVPIPSNSRGVIPYQLLQLIDRPIDRSRALFTNFFHLINLDLENLQSFSSEFETIRNKIESLHEICEKSIKPGNCTESLKIQHENLIELLRRIQQLKLANSFQFNTLFMELGVLLLFISFVGLLFDGFPISNGTFPYCLRAFIHFIGLSVITATFSQNRCEYPLFYFLKIFIIFVIFVHILLQLNRLDNAAKEFMELFCQMADKVKNPFLIIPVLHFISQFSSSFIEEEHQFWYFMSTSFFLYLTLYSTKKVSIYNSFSMFTECMIYISVPILDRFLRTVNQTGDKWAYLPDLGDWLNRPENVNYLMILLLISIFLIFFCLSGTSSGTSFVIFSFLIVNFTYRFVGLYKYHAEIYEFLIYISYLMIAQQIAAFIYCRLYRRFQLKYSLYFLSSFMSRFKSVKLSNVLLMLMIVICRPHNIVLLAGFVCKRAMLRKIWLYNLRHRNVIEQLLFFNMIGMMSFFQQGNSHSLSTVDIQTGYVGMRIYQPVLIGILLTIHTWFGHLFWIIVWIEWLSDGYISQSDLSHVSSRIQFISLAQLVGSFSLISTSSCLSLMLICSLMRYHLFVWSVFTPRLLYCCFFYLVLMPCYFVLSLIYFNQ